MKKTKPVILCVDDDPDFLESLRIIIEGDGYAMETAGSAEDGLKKYKQKKPDLLIVDLMMEEVDAGCQLVKDIKALGTTPPVYMLSSVGDGFNANADWSQLGLDGVFQKPINHTVLLTTLKARLRGKSA